MIRTIVIGMKIHNTVNPKCAPACEYVVMPPASLSTFAVINPGPMIETNNKNLVHAGEALRVHLEIREAIFGMDKG